MLFDEKLTLACSICFCLGWIVYLVLPKLPIIYKNERWNRYALNIVITIFFVELFELYLRWNQTQTVWFIIWEMTLMLICLYSGLLALDIREKKRRVGKIL